MAVETYDPFMSGVVEGDPTSIYAELRHAAPRLYIERYEAWFFSTFEDVWTLSKSQALSVAGGITPSQLLLGSAPNPYMVSQMDPPGHALFRSVLNSLFKPSAAQAMEIRIRGEARRLLVKLEEQGGGDFLMDYSGLLAVVTGCWLSGLPSEDAALLMQWTNKFFHRRAEHRGDTEIGGQAGIDMIAYITGILADIKKGKRAPEGAFAVLLEEQRKNPSITDDHVVFVVLNLQIAAGDTVPKGITATLHRLWDSPSERAKLRAAPDLALAAFLEAVRIDMPTQMQGRTVLQTFTHGDAIIQAGQKTMFMFASANRDSAEFDEPDRFLIDRAARRTLGFGNGLHRCLGVHVAQLEGQIAIEEVMARLPDYKIDLAASQKHKTEYVKGWSNLMMMV